MRALPGEPRPPRKEKQGLSEGQGPGREARVQAGVSPQLPPPIPGSLSALPLVRLVRSFSTGFPTLSVPRGAAIAPLVHGLVFSKGLSEDAPRRELGQRNTTATSLSF